MKHCMVKDCRYPVRARSLCSMHYWYWWSGKLKVKPPAPMTKAAAGAIGGSRGKKDGTIKGFGANRELASRAGTIGGRISRRYKHA